MIYWNKKEEAIIGKFLACEHNHIDKCLLLNWYGKGSVLAEYDMLMEDENDFEMDDERYEEFWSFAFHGIQIKGKPPISVNHQKNFLINYHNFPDEILVDGKKIN